MKPETMRGGNDPAFFAAAWDDAAPWDTGRPQPDVVRALEAVLAGVVADLGCGSGEHALWCAARGHEAFGVDVVPSAVERARAKAAARGLGATFTVGDALAAERACDTAIDVGLFHALSDADRLRYAATIDRILAPGGHLVLLCFSDRQAGAGYPRRVTADELRAFAAGFELVSLTEARYETVIPGGGEWSGAEAWLLVARRPIRAAGPA